MKGKTVVITGGTSGIGEIAAERLAQMGARIVLIARDKSRGEATLMRLHERAPGLGHMLHYADLGRIPEMKSVAAEVAHKEPRIDVLINNAGAMFSSRRWAGKYLRAKPHGLFRRHRGAARTAPGFIAGTHRQCFFSRPSGCQAGFRRPAIGEGLRIHESLWPLQALQHSFHARTRPPPAWHGGHCQLPASGLRRHTLRRPKRRRDLALRWARQTLRDFSRKGRGNNHLSGLVGRRHGNHGCIFLQVPPDNTVASGAGRQGCIVALGAQRGIGGLERLRVAANHSPCGRMC
jgi:hypothetical protein